MKPNKKSPLKDKPLRTPGQSLDEQRHDLAYDKLLAPFMLTAFMVIWAVMEWVRYFTQSPPSPIIYTGAALLALVYAIWQAWRTVPKIKQLRLASEGEKAVGQFLERLREDGYQVFHDLIGQGFNLDHVIVGPAGVFTIETKTFSKPAKGQTKILFDGENIVVAGFEPDRDPVIQAKAQVSWMKELLGQSTGRDLPVHPVILFPGWFIEQSPGSTKNIWVLEPKALPGFLSHQSNILSPEDVKLASFHLSRFIRASNQP